MGCLNSKKSQVLPVKQASDDCCTITTNDETQFNLQKSYVTRSIKQHSAKSHKSLGSCDSLDDERSLDGDRGLSATSKISKQSADSGIEEDNANIITEDSEKQLVDEVVNDFEEKEGLQLEISGVQCPTRLSAKQKVRQEEQRIIEVLRNEGLVSKPKAHSSGGLSFEIIQDRPDSVVPPARLEKLKEKKKKRDLTEDEIREKLFRAERRRKKREEERILKIKAMEKTESAGVIEAYIQRQKIQEEIQTKKMDDVVETRAMRLREIRDKLKEKERHAQEVRRRKQLSLDNLEPTISEEKESLS